jgi:hypothetical protein
MVGKTVSWYQSTDIRPSSYQRGMLNLLHLQSPMVIEAKEIDSQTDRWMDGHHQDMQYFQVDKKEIYMLTFGGGLKEGDHEKFPYLEGGS